MKNLREKSKINIKVNKEIEKKRKIFGMGMNQVDLQNKQNNVVSAYFILFHNSV